jgi:NAD(P)H-hydrate epimerase
MFKIASVDAVRRIEAACDAAGLTYDELMQRAGSAVCACLVDLRPRFGDRAKATFLIGPGNNGSDGLVAAHLLAETGTYQVAAYLLRPRPADDPHLNAARGAGVFIVNAEDDQRWRVLTNLVASSHVLVDALFGIGVTLPLRPEAARLLRAVTSALALNDESLLPPYADPIHPAPQPPAPLIVAVDCPSGVDCDTGAVDEHTLRADITLSFIAAKPGLLTFPAAEYVGRLLLADLGVSPRLPEMQEQPWELFDGQSAYALLPPRPSNGHKGTFGTALIVGGSRQYVGALALSAAAAYRSGTGLVNVAAPAPLVAQLSAIFWEATWTPLPHADLALTVEALMPLEPALAHADALIVGMGLGRDPQTQDFLRALLQRTDLPPLLLDADGLTLYSEMTDPPPLPERSVITPHPGELGRLLRISADQINSSRWEAAREAAQRFNTVCVLKGAHTLVAHPDGRIRALPFKTSALAKAGTGDVLSGVIGGLLAQGLPPFDAAAVGAYLHGHAGQDAEPRTLLARDLIDRLSVEKRDKTP